MPNIGPLEIIILLVIVLVIFGPKRLPELGRGLGKGMREFKDSVTGKDNDDNQKTLSASGTVQTSGQAPAPPEQAAAAQQQPPPAPAAAPVPPPEAEQAEPETARSGESRG